MTARIRFHPGRHLCIPSQPAAALRSYSAFVFRGTAMAHIRVPWDRIGRLLLLLVIVPIIVAVAIVLVFYRLHPWISAPH